MTLAQVIRQIELIASHQPSINMVVENDIFRLNEKADARYGVFGWTQGAHMTGVDRSTIDYSFTFFYVDRLCDSKRNQIEVQSVGVQTLDNIIRDLDARGLFVNADYTIRTFNQRFLDECGGAFCNVTISVPVATECEEEFGDFLENDFNDDFLIY